MARAQSSDPQEAERLLAELPDLQVEISVLTRPREISAVTAIEVGRHGLIVEDGRRRGLLLPQVAVEHRWTGEMFLEHTCIKAGLPRDAWLHGARILVFEAQVFGENQRAGTTAI